MGSVKINGVSNGQNAASGINVGTIPAGAITTVEFKLKVVSIPASGEIVNTADYSFNFTKDPSNPNGASGTESSNENEITGSKAKLSDDDVKKESNRTVTTVGDVITIQ